MDFCGCGRSGCDLEEYCVRWSFNEHRPIVLGKYDYNFFEELILCMKEQGIIELVNIDGKLYLNSLDALYIRDLEDKIINSLK